MLALQTHGRVSGVRGSAILKVLSQEEADRTALAPEKCLIWREQASAELPRREYAGELNVAGAAGDLSGRIMIDRIKDPHVVAPGDVIRVVEGRSNISVLYRRASRSNALLATEQCNSYCLMCSQPPKAREDRWLADEMLQTIPLIDRDQRYITISGGEPTLLDGELIAAIFQAKTSLPNTHLHILSNGRRFVEARYAQAIAAVKHPDIEWGVPLYAANAETHDYIVQSEGAWDQTLGGLYNLARNQLPVEIRVVVQEANIDQLGELAHFIFRNLSFAAHVTFMGLEPMGFARANRDRLWVDPAECASSLREAVYFLSNRGMAVSIYNLPLCALPKDLWVFARQSISDWKNIYLPSCEACAARERCSGFFASIEREWVSKAVRPIEISELRGLA